jgi:uncharacterized protein (TIGR00375 family)
MNYIADLHIHSLFSRATSKASNLAGLFAWALVKGIDVVGTGDFTHPGWFSQLKEQLVPAEPGFFRLKDENVAPALPGITPAPRSVRFVLTAEISSIYKRGGQVRKIHNILFAPDLESVARINRRLAAIGNIESDGRPILGLDSRDLLEILLEECPEGFLVPAHIWTPWFALFGSKSGFDVIEDCFGDLTEHIFALETGLSSDPDMNRLVSALDRFSLISNSDCHSPGKLGREANMFSTDFNYFAMREAIKKTGRGFTGTIEFYPEEGKYHLDGHRKCGVCLEPLESSRLNDICPVCGRPLTIGVSHRIFALADRREPVYPPEAPLVYSLIPLPEVLGEIAGYGPGSKTVLREYARVISRFGSEFDLLLNTPVVEIKQMSTVLAEAVKRIREKEVIKKPGFDGEFGVIHVFEPGEVASFSGQLSLFAGKKPRTRKKKIKSPELKTISARPAALVQSVKPELNREQQAAVDSPARRIIVTAGPGTGKTFTMVARLGNLLRREAVSPDKICAITFTNRAAEEIRLRLSRECGAGVESMFIGTFHAFCLYWLRQQIDDLVVIGAESREVVLKQLFPELKKKELRQAQKRISQYFLDGDETDNYLLPAYLAELARHKYLDLDAVIPEFNSRLNADPDFFKQISGGIDYLFVDEFQDVNRSQYELVEMLATKCSVFVIGDPDQAIYGFRGSDLSFFFKFSSDPATKCLNLSDNYRSASLILRAAGAVIKNNKTNSGLKLRPRLTGSGSISYYQALSPRAEAEYIVKSIEQAMGGISSFSLNSGRGGEKARSFADFAILYRLSRQAAPLAEALNRRGIPLQMVGSLPFFMENDVRPLYYWLQLAGGRAGAGEFLNLLSALPGFGQASIDKVEKVLSLAAVDLWEQAATAALPSRAGAVLAALCREIGCFADLAGKNLADALKKAINWLGIDIEAANTRRFLELAGIFKGVDDLARHLQKNKDAAVYDKRAEAVTLMTLHGAKGLEFPVVFIAGLEEGIIPHLAFAEANIAEERRLFYVGMTRAEEMLVLSSTRRGRTSRFLAEIPAECLVSSRQESKPAQKVKARQLKLF